MTKYGVSGGTALRSDHGSRQDTAMAPRECTWATARWPGFRPYIATCSGASFDGFGPPTGRPAKSSTAIASGVRFPRVEPVALM